jgi:hypothetical protein
MPNKNAGNRRPFRFHIPWITILIAILLPLISYCYMILPAGLSSNGTVMWLTSPFNISQEIAGTGIYYNYGLVIITTLIVELYSRNIAILQDRNFIMDNALILSVASAYMTSLIIWFINGMPSMGSSIIGFNLFIFFAIDLADSEFLVRVPADRDRPRLLFSVITVACIILMIDAAAVLYIYISGNQFWYVHLLGGAIFLQLFLSYLWFTKYAVDKIEKEVEVDVGRAVDAVERDIQKLEGGKAKSKQDAAKSKNAGAKKR